MRYIRALTLAAALTLAITATPAMAGWKLITAGSEVDLGGMQVMPSSDWNQASSRPGKAATAWTHDGFELNQIVFVTGLPSGEPIFKERNRKQNPMPRFDASMLLPDLADFLEKSIRAQQGVSDYTTEASEPAIFGGYHGLKVRYRYVLPDDPIERWGIARLAISNGRLYAIIYNAPRVHFFHDGLAEAETIMDSAKF